MQKLILLVSKPVAFILLLSFSFNASGQSISAKMEKDFRIDARIKVSQAAQVINTAIDAYERAGPKAFADSFGSILNPEEKTFVIKELKGLPPFPRLKMEGDKLVVFYKKEIIAQLESYDVAQGIFEGGPFHYTFDNNLGLIENLQSWNALDIGSAQNEQRSSFLMNLFIPQAEAKMTNKAAIPLMICGPLLGVLIGYYLGKPSNSPKVADANAAKAIETTGSTSGNHGQPGVDFDKVEGYPVKYKPGNNAIEIERAIQECITNNKAKKDKIECLNKLHEADKKRIDEEILKINGQKNQ
jgi:hypothetical protein